MRTALALPLALILILPVACSKKQDSGKTVIRYLANADVGGGTRVILDKFAILHPDIKVEMIEGPAASNMRQDMYSSSFMAKEDTYDIVHMDVAWMPTFAAQGWLLPLDQYFNPEMQSKFFPGDMEASKYKGKIYRVPNQSDGGALYYRKDLLDSRGIAPPKTFDELVKISLLLQSPPQLWGYVFQGKQYECLVCNFLEVLWGYGGNVIDEKGQVLLDQPESIAALQWMVDVVHKHKIAPQGVLTFQEEEARHMFQEGKALFMRNWPYAYNLMQEDKSPVKGKFAMIPMVHAAGKKSAATLGGWGYGISAFSKNPDAAWKFIEFATNEENQKIGFFKGGIIPPLKSLFKDPDILKAAPHIADIGEIFKGIRPRPVHPSYARISDIIQVHVSAALALQQSPQEAMSKASKELQSVLNRP